LKKWFGLAPPTGQTAGNSTCTRLLGEPSPVRMVTFKSIDSVGEWIKNGGKENRAII
jgi:hypothetical protein